jgi:CheY-like chemotaxis protein
MTERALRSFRSFTLTREASFVVGKYKQLKERGYDLFLNIARKEDYKRYREFRRNDFAVLFFFIFMAIITVFWGFGNSPLFHYFRQRDRISGLGMVGLLITLLGNICTGWLLFIWHYCHKYYQDVFFFKYLSQHVSKLEDIFIVCAPIGPGFNLLAASLNPDCRSFDTFFATSSRLCNPEAAVGALPQYITILVFIATEFSQCMVKCSHFRMVFISWFMSLLFISVAMFVSSNYTSVLFPVFSVFYGFVIYEIERRELDFFFKLKELYLAEESLLEQKHESQKQVFQAQTLNRIISNVSHDLISPLQALEMGLETVLRLIHSGKQRFASRLKERSDLHNHNIEEDVLSLDSCLELSLSMRDTLLFMSTIIYRCLDASTASGGSSLIPHCEYFDVQESINRVCLCITDMEKRVPLVVSPWPAGVLPSLKTDKRWLEGNLHCLITNAMKFSGNEKLPVELKIRFVNIGDPDQDHAPGRKGPTIYMLTIEVTDSGKEITAEARGKFFAAPEQIGRFDKGGAGMGLYALSKRVAALGGAFGSRPRADKKATGSVVWFSIPVTQSDATPRRRSKVLPAAGSNLAGVSAGAQQEFANEQMSFRRSDPSPGRVTAADRQDVRVSQTGFSTTDVTLVSAVLQPAAQVAERIMSPPVPSPVQGTTEKLISVRHIARPASKLHLESGVASGSASTEAENLLSEKSASGEEGSQNLQNLRVLVVDDAMTIMRITKMCLEKEGHVVDQAHNGALALDKMKENLYDVVLMDIQMPVMGGIESTQLIRASERAKEGPPSRSGKHQFIVGMSANGDADTRTETINSGMDAFIPKPFSLFRMMKILDELPDFKRVSLPVSSIKNNGGRIQREHSHNHGQELKDAANGKVSLGDQTKSEQPPDDVSISNVSGGYPLSSAAKTENGAGNAANRSSLDKCQAGDTKFNSESDNQHPKVDVKHKHIISASTGQRQTSIPSKSKKGPEVFHEECDSWAVTGDDNRMNGSVAQQSNRSDGRKVVNDGNSLNLNSSLSGQPNGSLSNSHRFQLTFKTDDSSGDEEFGITFDL